MGRERIQKLTAQNSGSGRGGGEGTGEEAEGGQKCQRAEYAQVYCAVGMLFQGESGFPAMEIAFPKSGLK